MDKKRIEVSSVDDFIRRVSLLKGTKHFTRTSNYFPIYRGQANIAWTLEPSAYRFERFQNESNYIREIERMEPQEFTGQSRIEKLIKMQHYGLPTRLIDFTYNSLVALYFACSEEPAKDGLVFEVHAFPLYHQDFVWISIIMKYLFEFNKLPFDPEVMIEELRNDNIIYPIRGVESFYNEEALLKILTSPHGIYPKFTNDRIRAQDGLFIISGMNIMGKAADGFVFNKISYSTIEEFWPESRSIIIPAERKKQLLNELDALGVNCRRLFPELESQAKFVTNYVDSQHI